jgi:hypothetical protein
MERPFIPGVIRGKLGRQSVMIFQQGIHHLLSPPQLALTPSS